MCKHLIYAEIFITLYLSRSTVAFMTNSYIERLFVCLFICRVFFFLDLFRFLWNCLLFECRWCRIMIIIIVFVFKIFQLLDIFPVERWMRVFERHHVEWWLFCYFAWTLAHRTYCNGPPKKEEMPCAELIFYSLRAKTSINWVSICWDMLVINKL